MTDDTKSFADHPESIAEIRSNAHEDAQLWTPRDALIAVLRDIDRGVIDPECVFIALGSRQPGNVKGTTRTRCNFVCAGGDPLTVIGAAQGALSMFIHDCLTES